MASSKMVNERTLSLDKSLVDYLPELEGRIEYDDQMILMMMLQHRTGIPNFKDHPDHLWSNPFKDNKSTLDLALDEPAEFRPDGRYRYF